MQLSCGVQSIYYVFVNQYKFTLQYTIYNHDVHPDHTDFEFTA